MKPVVALGIGAIAVALVALALRGTSTSGSGARPVAVASVPAGWVEYRDATSGSTIAFPREPHAYETGERLVVAVIGAKGSYLVQRDPVSRDVDEQSALLLSVGGDAVVVSGHVARRVRTRVDHGGEDRLFEMLFVFDFARGWIYKLTTTHVPDTDQFFASFVPGRIAGPTLATPTSDDELVERAARNVMWKNAPVWSSSTCYQSLKSMYEKRSRAKADVTTAILACSQDCGRGDTWACMLFDDFAKPSVVGVVCRRDPDFCTSACRENASPLLRATMCSTPIR